MPSGHFAKIEANQEVLFWHDQQRTWWQACRERRRNAVRCVVTTAVAAVVALGAWTVADRRARQRAFLEEVASGEPEVAFATLDQLAREGSDPEELRGHIVSKHRGLYEQQLRQRLGDVLWAWPSWLERQRESLLEENVEAQKTYQLYPSTIPDFCWLVYRYEVPGKDIYKARYPFTGSAHLVLDAIVRRGRVRYVPDSPSPAVPVLDGASEEAGGLEV